MPRRTLVLITAAVLLLHWLVLGSVPLAWNQPPPATDRVFSTRSIAAAPAPIAVAPPPSPPTPVARAKAPAPPRPRPAPVRKKAPDPAAGVAVAAPQITETAPDTGSQGEIAPPDAPASPDADSVANATADTASASPPPEAPAPPATPASDAQAAAAAGGVVILPPGGGAGSSDLPLAVRIPAPARLTFDVGGQAKKFTYQARAELLWQHDGSHYEARQEISAFLIGSRTQRSVGQITAQGLLPERFSDRSRSEQAAHFDYAQGRVTFSANTPQAAVVAGAQDRLSVFIQLGALLAGNPARFVPGTELTLTTVSARSADRWTFTVEGPETLELPMGPTPTIKLQRLPRKDYDQKAELWVAPTLGYLPVRIQLTQANGDFADLQLRSSSAP